MEQCFPFHIQIRLMAVCQVHRQIAQNVTVPGTVTQTRADAVNPGIKINGNQGTITQAVAEPERDAIYENEPVKPGDMVEIPGSDGRKYYKAAMQAEIDEYEKGCKI